jgi:hypothetical protein
LVIFLEVPEVLQMQHMQGQPGTVRGTRLAAPQMQDTQIVQEVPQTQHMQGQPGTVQETQLAVRQMQGTQGTQEQPEHLQLMEMQMKFIIPGGIV